MTESPALADEELILIAEEAFLRYEAEEAAAEATVPPSVPLPPPAA